jgi:hypothetical protein
VSDPPPKLKIVDYGTGNLRSVAKAFEHVGVATAISSDPEVIAAAPAIVLPGVGAFPEAAREIDRRGLAEPIVAAAGGGVQCSASVSACSSCSNRRPSTAVPTASRCCPGAWNASRHRA